jgi:hypothetical protein
MNIGRIAGTPRIARPCSGRTVAVRAKVAMPRWIGLLRPLFAISNGWTRLPRVDLRRHNQRIQNACHSTRRTSIIRGERGFADGGIQRP